MTFNINLFLEHKQIKWWSGCVTNKMAFGSIQGPCSVFEYDIKQ